MLPPSVSQRAPHNSSYLEQRLSMTIMSFIVNVPSLLGLSRSISLSLKIIANGYHVRTVLLQYCKAVVVNTPLFSNYR